MAIANVDEWSDKNKLNFMGGIYYNIWSCSKCEYTSRSVSGPFRVEPKVGTPPAKIEYRWCNDCHCIQRTFTGKADAIIPGREPDSLVSSWEFSSLEKFEEALQKLEQKKKNNIFFFLTKDSKKLKNYYISKALCEKYTKENVAFYEKLKPIPKCLICGGTNVSQNSYDNDRHICGGEFIRKDSGRMGSVGQFQVIEYSSDGSATSEMRNMR